MSLRRSARIQSNKPADTLSIDTQDDLVKTVLKKGSEAQIKRGKRARNDSITEAQEGASTPRINKKSKKSTTKAQATEALSALDPPKTPNTKRQKPAAAIPPITPTPSAIGLMASSPTLNGATPKPRLAEPHVTNAPVRTPGGSRVTAYSAADVDDGVPPAAAGEEMGEVPITPTTTTENLLAEAVAHLIRVDPRLKAVIEKHPCHIFSPQGLQEEVDPFRSLVSGIMAQQVSGAAAKSIKNKFIALFPTPSGDTTVFPTPAQVAVADISFLRTAGLSQRKAEYVKGLAEKFANGELSAEMLVRASDAEVLEKLTAVRGLGKWSVEMFACFTLKRMDVFSTGDLGVQRGMAAWMGRDVGKLKAKGGNNKWKYMTEKEMLEHSAKFAPYRSLFMWYMWRIEDVNLDAIQGA